MAFSEEIKELLEKINDQSKKPLKNVYEVSVILENNFFRDDTGLFKDLIFTAKYVNGLKSVLSNQIVNKDDFMERMFEEFNKNVQIFSGLLKVSVESAGEKIQDHFSKKYFELNHDSLVNTMELIEDFSMCKEYFNRYPEEL